MFHLLIRPRYFDLPASHLEKITFFVVNSITYLNSFEVKAVLKHKVINLIPSLFYCSADEDFLQRQFIEKAVHQLTLWILFLQCRKPVYLFISDSLDSVSCSTVRQRQPADSQMLGPEHVLAENPACTTYGQDRNWVESNPYGVRSGCKMHLFGKAFFQIAAFKTHPYTLTVFFLLALQGWRRVNIAFCFRFFLISEAFSEDFTLRHWLPIFNVNSQAY